MKVARVCTGVNTPLKVYKSVNLRKASIRVSDLDTVLESDGKIVGYTNLKLTSDKTLDRIKIGSYSYIVEFGDVSDDALQHAKYCICVDDTKNKYVLFVGRWEESKTSEWDEPATTEFLRRTVIGVCVPILAFCIFKLVTISSDISDSTEIAETVSTEAVSDTVTIGGGTYTYVYGAYADSTEPTDEDIVNQVIEEEAPLREAEKDATIPGATNNSTTLEAQDTTSQEDATTEYYGEPSTEQLQISSINDTVIVTSNSDEASTEDVLGEEFFPKLGNITISSKSPDYSVKNTTGYALTVTITIDDMSIASISLSANESASITLLGKVSETSKAMISYDYKDVDNKTIAHFDSDITIYVND